MSEHADTIREALPPGFRDWAKSDRRGYRGWNALWTLSRDQACALVVALERAEAERDVAVEALREIAGVMDYDAHAAMGCGNTCPGCIGEMVEASRIVRAALAAVSGSPAGKP